ncbi:MAG: CHASE2 domain-containing protein, partial [Alphaproteobacteria bacterium]|nr:CHASE2 domain-containing protein [Alphaproteobacteria bacterium]
RPLIILSVLTLLALSLVLLLRSLGALEGLELKAYDAYLELAGERRDPSPSVVMVEFTEEDEATFGFPLPDDRLADLFELLTAKGAVAIGLDLIRDRPEPKAADQSAFERLSRTLRDQSSIVGIVKDGAGAFGPPPALADRPLQIASAAILPDADGRIRRGLLHLTEQDGARRPTLALMLAARYLAANDVAVDWPAPDRLRLGDHEIRPFSPEASGFYRQHGGFGGGYQFLLTFPACATGFERHRVGDLLGGDAEAIDLQGRIVLVGNTVRAAKDVVDLPIDCAGMLGGKMFGLHLHGQIIEQLIGLSEGDLSPLETTEQRVASPLLAAAIDGGWIWLWTILGGLIALLLPSPLWLAIGAGVCLFLLAGSTLWLFAAAGWWLPSVPPALGFALALTLAIAYVMTRARSEREDIMALFSGVVSKGVADAIWRRRDRAEDETLQLMTATVMFTDIKGFTTISESLAEPVLADWLNDYMAAMVDIVATHGGVIEKFAGDGLTIEFGVPEARESEAEIDADARSAVDCALAMALALPALNADWREKGLPTIGIRVGIHTGPLMVGVIGSADRWQYSIIGDTANTAARLESYAKDDPGLGCDVGHCRILISGATFDRLGEGFRTEFVGEASLKGKALTIDVHRVHGRD